MEFNNHKSIFLQIAESITEKIANGTFQPGEKVPSVRELASEVGVNPNTIMRTYSELQSQNIIENKRGIGYFVHQEARQAVLAKKRKEFFDKVLPALSEEAKLLGITPQEIIDQLDNTIR